ncbi:PIN domain-containing protein [Thermococcus stetteri]|uniref:PIN domain-containing protein n=1 Tax=Thermococcus stetteri TaxID=49900 RepID=UPI001AE1C4A3|nr:PIN domain-containing protein [Thermococcus stetteri]MBP1912424.1 rRNA-processing protein FCF1 [Thermococcus stetteri]
MAGEVVIEKPELQILINLIQERDQIRVHYPIYNTLLFTARPFERGYIVDVKAEKRDFHVRHPELPSYSDFYEAFISSGVIMYDNIDDFKEMLELYQFLRKGVVFSPDTNIFYHRFISNYRPLDGYHIVVAEDVKNEIESAMNYKYHSSYLHEIMDNVKNGHLLRELSNRRTKKARKASYIALKEFEALRDRIIVVERYGEGHNNDERIVKTLKHYDEMSPAMVVFLTADLAITDVARIEGLEYFYFEYPTARLSTHEVSAYQLRTLIFNLAAVFGLVEVNGTLVYGEFGGKKRLNELKLVFRSHSLMKKFLFHLDLCRKLRKIMEG